MKYTKNFNTVLFTATNVAAKRYGVDAAELRKHYRDFQNAPAGLKPALLLTYKVMKGYRAKAEVPADGETSTEG